jgi:hypothetical protein
MSLTSRITRPSGPNEELVGATPKLPGCPEYIRVPSRWWRVVGPAITGERPVEQPLRVVRIGDVDNRHDAAYASKALADVVRLAVLSPPTHVARAIGHGDAGRSFGCSQSALGHRREIRAVTLGEPEESALSFTLMFSCGLSPPEFRSRYAVGRGFVGSETSITTTPGCCC